MKYKKKERSLYTLTRRRRLEKIYRENPPPFLFAALHYLRGAVRRKSEK
jgi:hypothetical protein